MSGLRRGDRLIQPREAHLGYHLRRAAAAMQADLAPRVGEHGVTIVEMSALFVIQANPKITQSEIGRMLAIKSANMAPLTAGLVARALVKREVVDGRSVGLCATSKGEALCAALHQCVAANEQRLLARVPESERRRLLELVRLTWSPG